MEKSFSPELTLYGQILFVILFVALAGLVMALLRRVMARPAAGGGKAVSGLPSRLLLPVSLLAAAGLVKLPVLRTALPLGAKFFRFVDAAFVFFVIFLLVRLLDGLARARYEKKGRPFPLPRVLHGFFLIIVYIAAALAILREFLGFNITPLLAGSAILTAVLGLALQGVLGNVFSGMSLHYTRSFSRGDWIKIGETEGQVVDTNWRETRLRDRASNIVVIPNTVVASQTIVNFSLPDRASAVVLPVKVDFLAPPAVVLGILVEAAKETAGVLAEPAPTAYLLSYDEFGLSYLAKFWISDYGRRPAIAGEVGRLVWHKLRRRGIEIPVPVESRIKDVLRVLRPSEDRIAEISTEKEKNFQDFARSAFLQTGEGERPASLSSRIPRSGSSPRGPIAAASAPVKSSSGRAIRGRSATSSPPAGSRARSPTRRTGGPTRRSSRSGRAGWSARCRSSRACRGRPPWSSPKRPSSSRSGPGPSPRFSPAIPTSPTRSPRSSAAGTWPTWRRCGRSRTSPPGTSKPAPTRSPSSNT